MASDDPLQRLKDYLAATPPSAISDTEELEGPLAACWGALDGGDATGMEGFKLRGRMKNVKWEPPVLSFDIVRHGAMEKGKSTGEVAEWSVNIETAVARWSKRGSVQLVPRRPPLDVARIAEDLVQKILESKEDPGYELSADGNLKILIGKIIPDAAVPKDTVTGQRKRFRTRMDALLAKAGWESLDRWRYARMDAERD